MFLVTEARNMGLVAKEEASFGFLRTIAPVTLVANFVIRFNQVHRKEPLFYECFEVQPACC
jgi:hypothetical protein